MIRLAIRVPLEHSELVLAELLELTPSGVEESEVGEGMIEYAVYGAPGELPELPDLQAAAGGVRIDVSSTEVAEDWGERWKQFHRPILLQAPDSQSAFLLPSLHVRPPWEPPSERLGVEEIVIDPGQAFGTGAHATTRMCLELLLSLTAVDGAAGSLLDVGSGSGVLAIAASKLGYKPVLAVDNDPESIAAILSNSKVNEVDVDARRFDLRTEPLGSLAAGWEQLSATVLLANLLRPLLIDLDRSIDTPPKHLVASGLLASEVDEIAGLYQGRLALHERERRLNGEWGAVWLSASE